MENLHAKTCQNLEHIVILKPITSILYKNCPHRAVQNQLVTTPQVFLLNLVRHPLNSGDITFVTLDSFVCQIGIDQCKFSLIGQLIFPESET